MFSVVNKMGFKLKNVNKIFGCGRISGEGLCCLIMGGVMTVRLIMESCCVG